MKLKHSAIMIATLTTIATGALAAQSKGDADASRLIESIELEKRQLEERGFPQYTQ